jgi:heme/copper-type cytochrome/quinol oxidase subunit 2
MKPDYELIAIGMIAFFTSALPLVSLPICVWLILCLTKNGKDFQLKEKHVILLLIVLTIISNLGLIYLYIFKWQIFSDFPKITVL